MSEYSCTSEALLSEHKSLQDTQVDVFQREPHQAEIYPASPPPKKPLPPPLLPPTKTMTHPVLPTRNRQQNEKGKKEYNPFGPPTPISKNNPPHLLRSERYAHIHPMSPRRTRQPPPHNLSWFSARRRQATLTAILTPSSRNHRRLEAFRHHIRAHDIPYLGASYQVYVLGPHSRQYFRTSLRSLLTLDYVPRKVKIPVLHIPHDCFFCQEVTQYIYQRCRPFEYVAATSRSRGRPRRDSLPSPSSSEDSVPPPPSSSEDSISELDSTNSEPPDDDDSITTTTSVHNGSPPPEPPPSPPTPNPYPPTA